MTIIVGKITSQGSGGNNIFKSGPYTVHEFNATANFTPTATGRVDVLAIGGGGSGGPGPSSSAGSGGGGGAVLVSKFNPVVSGSPYTMSVGGVNGNTVANWNGGSLTAPAGAQGRNGASGTNVGNDAPLASGSGGTGWNTSNGGVGANIAGQGFPGFQDAYPGASNDSAGGGGAGSGGPVTTASKDGGSGTPIAYFTGITTHTNASAGGPGRGGNQTARTGIQYGNGGGSHPGSGEGTQPSQPGAIFIRYI